MPVDFKYRFFYLIIGFTFYTLTGSAQADKDSLLKVVQNSQDINAKLSAQNRLTYYMMWTDIDSAHKMLDELAPHVKKVGNLENQARFISL